MTDFVEGNRITLLTRGSEYFPQLEAACEEAQREIHIETYIYDSDEAGRRVGEALKRAARRGVATHVLMDGFGSKKLSGGFVADLESAGVRVLVYRPERGPLFLGRRRLRRNEGGDEAHRATSERLVRRSIWEKTIEDRKASTRKSRQAMA